jgi:hypothetical protein
VKHLAALHVGLFFAMGLFGQKKADWSFLTNTEQIVKTLASDEMTGRMVFTKGNDKAAAFINGEFKKAGLLPWDGKSFLQPFNIDLIQFISADATINGEKIDENNVLAFSDDEILKASHQSIDFDTAFISKSDTFFIKLGELRRTQKNNLIVFVDTSHHRYFKMSKTFHNKYYSGFREYNSFYYSDKKAIVVLTDKRPYNWSFDYRQVIEKKKCQNVVGILPGKDLREQNIVFSAHFDHVGILKPNSEGDSIYNGANDDASGVAAIIQLANHFVRQKSNRRTLVFSAFNFEESGGFGAMYFTRKYDSSAIVADFNIEMIGTAAEAGPDVAIVTGYEFSDFGAILQKNLKNTNYRILPDPYKEMNLFIMSDNITLARKGVPAHTISTSRGFKEPYFHTPDDEWDKFDYRNMNEIIKAIATSAISLINGNDTPSRIDVSKISK